MRLIFYICCLFFPVILVAQGERHNFSKLDIYNGLSHNQVTGILKDSTGFLWFGTMSGLNRYDGYSCKVFRNKRNDSNSLVDNFVSALYELPGRKMFVMTRVHSCIYDSRTEKFDPDFTGYLQSLGLPGGWVDYVAKGANGRYWFLYDKLGLYLYSAAEQKATQFRPVNSFSRDKIASVVEGHDGMLWIVYQNGILQKFDVSSNKIVFTSDALQKMNKEELPYKIFADKEDDVWLWCNNTPKGIFLFRSRDNSIRQINENTTPSKLNANLIKGVIQNNDGIIWVATDHGGLTLVDKTRQFATSYLVNDPKNPRSLGHNSITSLYKDDNDIIWIGTYKQGVNFLNERIVKFPLYHHQEFNTGSLQYNDVNRFVEDKNKNLWIGTNGGGLIYFDRAKNNFKQFLHDPGNKNSLSNNIIVSLCIDHENKLWIGSYFGGLDCFDGKNFTHYKHDNKNPASLADDRVWEIFEDRDQNLWVGTMTGGLALLDRKTSRFEHYRFTEGKPSPLQSNYISAILQDRKGNLWIGTAYGVTVFEKNKITPAYYQHNNNENSISNNNIICLLEDSKGRIWIGTREGLNLWNGETKSFRVFTTADGLPDNIVLNILEDNQQKLWLTTPNGLCNATLQQQEKDIDLSFITYDEMNNLQDREFNENAALKTAAGELIFGGPGGFNIIDPMKTAKPVYDPRIVFTGLQILNNNVEVGEEKNNRVLLQQSLSQQQSIDLKFKENVFSIEFASLNFYHNGKDKYAYMLEGFNGDWLYSYGDQHRATYTNLDPGHYTFKVKVLNGDGTWSKVKTLKINIAPPFWRTPLAYIIYVLVIIGLLLLIRRITLERIHMRFEMKQQRREAERAYALDQLKTKFFTNVSHEFRTPLSLIISPAEKLLKGSDGTVNDKKHLRLIHRNARRLLNLVNQLLDFRKMEEQELRLNKTSGDIIDFVREVSSSFADLAENKQIDFSVHAAEDVLFTGFDHDKLDRILFNLLSNAFKFTPAGGTIQVHVALLASPGERKVQLKVIDTGIGISEDKHEKIFERFFQNDIPGSLVNQGSGIGLAITKEFVRMHDGTITVESEPGKGSCFIVTLPVTPIQIESDILINNQPGDVGSPEVAENLPVLQVVNEKKSGGKKKTVLLVEDNEDFRFYIKDNLKTYYNIIEAPNGKTGWQMTLAEHPDLVVCDVSMPEMNGIDLCRKIKEDKRTSFIPVILLTALTAEEQQLEGLHTGADDYITKPFNFEILLTRIRNFLSQQERFKKTYQKQVQVQPSELAHAESPDQKFLQHLLTVIEKNISNADFSVEELSREVFMSRVALYKRIFSLTGKTPIEFIRSIRLQRAAQLLLKKELTVTEVAYEVGFNTTKYFSRYFKMEYGVMPSDYTAEKKAE